MPSLLDTPSRTAALVRAINDVLAEGGPAALTLRRIADVSGVSTSSMFHQYGSREHLLRVAAHRTGQARRQRVTERMGQEGPFAFLPWSDEDLLAARAWLAWQEVWRSDESLGRVVHEMRLNEFALFARATGFALSRNRLDTAWALVDGLHAALCAPRTPMRPAYAREILRLHLRTDVTPPPPDVSSW